VSRGPPGEGGFSGEEIRKIRENREGDPAVPLLKKFDHIGIVVKDLQRAMDVLFRVFGLECQEQKELVGPGIRVAF
jgi:hypothetical protein